MEISEIFEVVDSFSTCCPLCHAPDCAQLIGYYYRQVIDGKGQYYPRFPVPRFLCHRKAKHTTANHVNHKTFSLLHYHLVPYSKYSLPFVVKVLKLRHIDGMTVESIQTYLGDIAATAATENDCRELSASGIFAFKHLFLAAINKILISGYYPQLIHELGKSGEETAIIKIFLTFCRDFTSQKHSCLIRGPCAISYDFYITGGFYLKNAYFLFGTPSQFRKAETLKSGEMSCSK